MEKISIGMGHGVGIMRKFSPNSYASIGYLLRCLSLFTSVDRRKIVLLTVTQIIASFLDLIGVALVGVLGALGVTGIESRKSGDRVNFVLDLLKVKNLGFQKQVLILALVATFVLTFRTIISVLLTRKTLNFLSNRAAGITGKLSSKILNSELAYVRSNSSQRILYQLTTGVGILVLGVLGTVIGLIADFSLLIVIITGLLIVDPSIAISTFLLFGGIGTLLYRIVSSRARNSGALNMELSIESSETILEALDAYRVAVVRNRRYFYSGKISSERYKLSKTQADLQFLPSITKYVIESVMLLGVLLVAGLQFAIKDAVHATAIMALFMAASSRIAPAVMRIQQAGIQIRSNASSAYATLDLIDVLEGVTELEDFEEGQPSQVEFIPEIRLKDVNVSYELSDVEGVLREINLDFKPGTMTAIVGPSGSGKSTLLDAILGIKSLKSGDVLISGVPPLKAFAKWPNAVGFVPQETYIRKGTIRENVALGFPQNEIDDEAVIDSLRKAQLFDFVTGFEKGIYAQIGELGSTISGGQKQRLGIARALYCNPQVIILDEATSSLDAMTEEAITAAIRQLKGSVTLILVAHRLSTIRDSDNVIYLDKGHIVASGSFEQVRNLVKDFENQAQIMGL